uniref:T-complex protein 1 subunit zeta n=1 Tax=Cacopsylla melanoneura TaxID=428564 RepID=A0A8D8UTP5_9HEMI
MAAISYLNPKAEFARAAQALALNISAAKGIQDVMRTNLGPRGTMKMLVSGAGDIKITKDGNVLLHEMQTHPPTASLIARASTAMDDMTGDGTTSTVLVIGELLKQADIYIAEGLHPRVITEGFTQARLKVLETLEELKINSPPSREILLDVTRTSLRTKVDKELADLLSDVCVDAILSIHKSGKELDLHMVELMEMKHKTSGDSCLVKGVVLDHGARHPDMPKSVKNAFILTCNVSMEYEKSEVNSGFFYKTAEDREKFVAAEREFIEQRVHKIIELKKKVCEGTDKTFVVINQKGIDPQSLDLFAREGIIALRRAKRRNMERLTLACGGVAMNSVEGLEASALGFAGSVYEHVLGEEKFTFVEECRNPESVTILLKGPNKHTLMQTKDAVRDGLRAIKNTIDDGAVVPGAGAFEIAAWAALQKYKNSVKGKSRLGIQAYAEALLVIPKTIAVNSGFDAQDTIVKLQEAAEEGVAVGVDINSGEVLNPTTAGIYDNLTVKRQIINSCTVIASNLLLVDEVMRAGMSSLKG